MVKILVPVDFSNTSKNALRYAADLHRNLAVEITLLHIFGAESTALTMKSIDHILIENSKTKLLEVIEDMKIAFPEVTFNWRLSKNYAAETISRIANSDDYDLIVMGTKGASGLKEVFIGSVAGEVVSKAKIPVIVVPLDYKFDTLDNVVLAIGNDSFSNTGVIKPLKLLFDLHHVNLEILNISDSSEKDLSSVISILEELKPKVTFKRNTGDLNHQLNVHIQNNDTDLLCLLRTKKDVLSRLFNGSVTLKQTFNCPVPLLILQN